MIESPYCAPPAERPCRQVDECSGSGSGSASEVETVETVDAEAADGGADGEADADKQCPRGEMLRRLRDDAKREKQMPHLRTHWSKLVERFDATVSDSPRAKKKVLRRRTLASGPAAASGGDPAREERARKLQEKHVPYGPYTVTQVAALGEILARVDDNLNGEIDAEEFMAASVQPDIHGGQLFSGVDFTTIDKDASGAIGILELVCVVFPKAKPHERRRIEKYIKERFYHGRLMD
jgi:hypothetical protein